MKRNNKYPFKQSEWDQVTDIIIVMSAVYSTELEIYYYYYHSILLEKVSETPVLEIEQDYTQLREMERKVK